MIISHKQAGTIDSLSRSQRERLVKTGDYPQPVRLTEGRVGFVEAEVRAWAAERIAARDAAKSSQNDRTAPATARTQDQPSA